MKATVDAEGRISPPAELRAEAALYPGLELEARIREGRIELAPAEAGMRFVRQAGLLVAVPDRTMPTLSADSVQAVIEEVRRERGQDLQ